MNREQMIEEAAKAALEARFETLTPEWRWSRVNEAKRTEARKQARAMLDAILPQIITVAELEALPEFSIVVGAGPDGDVWSRIPGPMLWAGAGCEQPDTSEHVVEWGAPLTVVWQPEVTA